MTFEPIAFFSRSVAKLAEKQQIERARASQEVLCPKVIDRLREEIKKASQNGLTSTFIQRDVYVDIFDDCSGHFFRRRRKYWSPAALRIFETLEAAGYKLRITKKVFGFSSQSYTKEVLLVWWK